MKNKSIITVLLVPVLFSIGLAVTNHPVFMLGYVGALFIGIAVFPGFRSIENKAMFSILTVTSVPLNVGLVIRTVNSVSTYLYNTIICKILFGVFLYGMLFCFENIAAAIVVRCIWPDQPEKESVDNSVDNKESEESEEKDGDN